MLKGCQGLVVPPGYGTIRGCHHNQTCKCYSNPWYYARPGHISTLAACRGWGIMTDEQGAPILGEPNNFDFPPESCAGCNYTESLKTGAWGWADTNCTRQHIVMCRIAGGWCATVQCQACECCMTSADPQRGLCMCGSLLMECDGAEIGGGAHTAFPRLPGRPCNCLAACAAASGRMILTVQRRQAVSMSIS